MYAAMRCYGKIIYCSFFLWHLCVHITLNLAKCYLFVLIYILCFQHSFLFVLNICQYFHTYSIPFFYFLRVYVETHYKIVIFLLVWSISFLYYLFTLFCAFLMLKNHYFHYQISCLHRIQLIFHHCRRLLQGYFYTIVD